MVYLYLLTFSLRIITQTESVIIFTSQYTTKNILWELNLVVCFISGNSVCLSHGINVFKICTFLPNVILSVIFMIFECFSQT